MKKNIHPQSFQTQFYCINCETTHTIGSTIKSDDGPVKIETCSHCHPAYNKGQVIIETKSKGRLQAYEEKLARMKAAQAK